ncbi:helix-turn-helix domain-containing protein [Massilia aurea]|jgi:XRE family transcriptional regulator, regulator of sulfur utilization|uniref:helix-turn-helix domain-containing protein n=1 Tax=Massilia aurea TaxID=373040 RepID=UPI002163C68B|nr:XRE family transcriptional regulator [Massilia aurea]MCS0709748.1 XRE family transcriptional regulator [Massilia aurea]
MNTISTNNAPPEVGATLQRLRLARGLTLEDLSRIAGVSKSMLSQIEREKANPTIAITWRLANALGVQISELLSSDVRPTELIRLVDAHEIPTLPGAHAGYSLRILGPMDLAGKYEWYELTLAPGGELASQAHDPGTGEHLTVITGTVELEVGLEKKKVRHGATARYPADQNHVIRNTGKTEAKAVLVVVHR